MNIVRIILASLALTFAVLASAAEKDMEVSCTDSFYMCLKGDDLKAFAGKTLKYKHPRASEFGVVSVTLRTNGWLNISNAKGTASGTWRLEGDKINLDIVTWGEKYSFRFVTISGRLFGMPNVGTGGGALYPVDLTD